MRSPFTNFAAALAAPKAAEAFCFAGAARVSTAAAAAGGGRCNDTGSDETTNRSFGSDVGSDASTPLADLGRA